MKVSLTCGNWDTQRVDARAVRFDVFVVEQKIPVELEWDDLDPVCLHVVACDETGQAVGTGRLLPDGHIGRMAVIKAARGFGVGGAIIELLLQEAHRRGDHAVRLNAQTHAERFYARFGFSRDGAEFKEAGISHIQMRYEFS